MTSRTVTCTNPGCRVVTYRQGSATDDHRCPCCYHLAVAPVRRRGPQGAKPYAVAWTEDGLLMEMDDASRRYKDLDRAVARVDELEEDVRGQHGWLVVVHTPTRHVAHVRGYGRYSLQPLPVYDGGKRETDDGEGAP